LTKAPDFLDELLAAQVEPGFCHPARRFSTTFCVAIGVIGPRQPLGGAAAHRSKRIARPE